MMHEEFIFMYYQAMLTFQAVMTKELLFTLKVSFDLLIEDFVV